MSRSPSLFLFPAAPDTMPARFYTGVFEVLEPGSYRCEVAIWASGVEPPACMSAGPDPFSGGSFSLTLQPLRKSSASAGRLERPAAS